MILKFSKDEINHNLQTEAILEEYNIYRNPSWLMVKGTAIFRKKYDGKETEINLQAFPGGIGLSNQDIEDIYWNSEIAIKKIVTIENLTSFYQWKILDGETTLCIYLGGFVCENWNRNASNVKKSCINSSFVIPNSPLVKNREYFYV